MFIKVNKTTRKIIISDQQDLPTKMRINDSDMIPYSDVLRNTPIADFYANKNILITGATGFMGKVLLETLLRKCDGINCIYIVVRMKRGGKNLLKI